MSLNKVVNLIILNLNAHNNFDCEPIKRNNKNNNQKTHSKKSILQSLTCAN